MSGIDNSTKWVSSKFIWKKSKCELLTVKVLSRPDLSNLSFRRLCPPSLRAALLLAPTLLFAACLSQIWLESSRHRKILLSPLFLSLFKQELALLSHSFQLVARHILLTLYTFLKNVVSGSLNPRCGTSPANKEINRGTRLSLVWLKPDCAIKFWTLHCILIIFGPLCCSFGQNETINEAEIDCRTLFFLSLCSWRNPCASDFWGSNHHSHVTARHCDITAREFELNSTPQPILPALPTRFTLGLAAKTKTTRQLRRVSVYAKEANLFLAPARVKCRGVILFYVLGFS